ncbi:MAG TPA: polysaccharide deacetylase family protein [Rhizobiaceae bacterium]|nr:polysaccharide deacetylase family protein [Rhizobiaceae bacterium]
MLSSIQFETDTSLPGRGNAILMYHQIDAAPAKGIPFRQLTTTPNNFYRQMIWLARIGYRGVSVRELAPYIKGEKQGKVFGITFDDGFQSVYRNALPILRQFGFTATCFFVSGQVGGSNRWDAEIGVPYAPCMSRREMLDWAAAGNEIGSHTIDHVRLTQVSLSAALDQIEGSRTQLKDMAGTDIVSFCYPYGDVSNDVMDMVRKAGFSLATTTRKGRASSGDDPLLLPRRNIRLGDGWLATLRKTILGRPAAS